MTQPAAEHVANVDPNAAITKATDKADEHTPAPNVGGDNKVTEVADKTTDNDSKLDALTETVAGIGSAVANLTETVTKLVGHPADQARDEGPGGVPWTHKGGHRV